MMIEFLLLLNEIYRVSQKNYLLQNELSTIDKNDKSSPYETIFFLYDI